MGAVGVVVGLVDLVVVGVVYGCMPGDWFGLGLGKLQPSASKKRSKSVDTVMGYEVRKPYSGEDKYFKENPGVAGMAAEDGRIVLNPYSKNKPEEQAAVARNEAMRLWMRDNKLEPKFNVTPEQLKSFEGTEYGKPENLLHLKHTLIARILSGDPSAGNVTEMQRKWAEYVSSQLPK